MSVTRTEPADMKAEKAVTAYLRGFRDEGASDHMFEGDIDTKCRRTGDLYDVDIYEGRRTNARQYPCVVVACPTSRRMYDGVDWFEVDCEISLHTHRNEDEENTKVSEVNHAYRCREIEDLIMDEQTLKLALNRPPVPAEDTREVSGFTLMGMYHEDTGADVVNEAHVQTWTLKLICCPWDATQ